MDLGTRPLLRRRKIGKVEAGYVRREDTSRFLDDDNLLVFVVVDAGPACGFNESDGKSRDLAR